MITRSTLRRSAYYDSVTLMQAQQSLRTFPGIAESGVVMGTEANLDLLRRAGLDPGGIHVTPDDLVVTVQGDTEEHVEAALAALDTLLARRPAAGSVDTEHRPRTVSTAARLLPGANVALISVPGRFAAPVAGEALAAGLHVMLFSDNVPLEDEARLKEMGRAHGRVVMGPDCGTAVVGGAALGFANRVRRGPVGVVAAAGTGLQEVVSIIHRRGGGISHAIGTGGRDLNTSIGGATMSRALAVLGRDPGTSVVVMVSKPPDPEVAGRLLTQAEGIGKPVVVAFVGAPTRGDRPAAGRGTRCVWAATFEEAALLALHLAGTVPYDAAAERTRSHEALVRRARAAIGRLAPSQRYLRGLYSGGALCAEGVALLQGVLRPLYSNVPTGEAQRHTGVGPSLAHAILDLGDDIFTVGRLHPMLDMAVRVHRLAEEAAEAEVAVVLLDVVLGEGVHPDPAGALIPAIQAAHATADEQGRALAVVASVCGTDEDPQHYARQVERLEAAGVLVESSNARAAILAGMIVARDPGAVPADRLTSGGAAGPPLTPAQVSSAPRAGSSEGEDSLLAGTPRVVNVGLALFAESLRAQHVPVIDVDWRPPAGGDREMIDLLERLR